MRQWSVLNVWSIDKVFFNFDHKDKLCFTGGGTLGGVAQIVVFGAFKRFGLKAFVIYISELP